LSIVSIGGTIAVGRVNHTSVRTEK
jgi:hypothetical protein